MADFSKDQMYIDWFLKNQKAIEKTKKRSEDAQKPASSQNFSF